VAACLLFAPAAPAADDTATLERYARATWDSFVAMTDPASGLPTDVLHTDGTTAVQTSTTNIGAYMWSAVAAERLGLIAHGELVERLEVTLGMLERMERHEPSGQYYNWYDHHTGAKLTTWPPSGEPLTPILSSVDNAWLATGLRIVESTVPELSGRAGAIYDSMDFGFYYVPAQNRILFHYVPSTGTGPCCYDTVVSESRIADYIGTAKGELPRRTYYGRWRTFPDTCDFSFQETRPAGFSRSYDGVDVYDGSYPYGDTRLTPSWGGSMFEALMPALFVPEERWGAGSWRQNHPLTVDAQIDHGLKVGGLWGLGLLALEYSRGWLRRLRGRRRWDGPERQPLERGPHPCRSRLRGLPGARPCPGSAAERVHERRRDAACRVPGAALPAASRNGEPRAPGKDPRDLRPVGIRGLGKRGHRLRVARLPLARPGNDHGGPGERPGRRHAAQGVLDRGLFARNPPGARGGGVQRVTARLHD
jgi:hypothetical protein